MSIDALKWAFNVSLPSSGTKLVLLTLANFANEDSEAYPSQNTIAEKACLSERAVRDHLARLEGMKLIKRVARTRANGSYTTDLFLLNVGAVPEIPPSDDAENQRQNLPTAESASGRIFQTQRQNFPNPAAESAGPDPLLNTTITKNNHTPRELLRGLGVPDELADAWIRVRKEKRLAITVPALDAIQREAEKAGLSFEQAIRTCCEKGWGGFMAKWLLVDDQQHGPPSQQGGPPWWASDAGIMAKGTEVRLLPRPGESMASYKARINERLNEQMSCTA